MGLSSNIMQYIVKKHIFIALRKPGANWYSIGSNCFWSRYGEYVCFWDGIAIPRTRTLLEIQPPIWRSMSWYAPIYCHFNGIWIISGINGVPYFQAAPIANAGFPQKNQQIGRMKTYTHINSAVGPSYPSCLTSWSPSLVSCLPTRPTWPGDARRPRNEPRLRNPKSLGLMDFHPPQVCAFPSIPRMEVMLNIPSMVEHNT